MKMKYVSVVVLAIVIFSVSAYYLYNQNNEYKYYRSYEMQINSTNKSMDLCQSAMSSIMISMMGQNVSSSNIKADLVNANSSNTMAINYSQQMVNSSKTNSEKQYAQLLLKQSNGMSKFIDLLIILSNSSNDTGKVNDIMEKLNAIKTEEESYQTDLDDIRANNPDLDKRLTEIEKKYNG